MPLLAADQLLRPGLLPFTIPLVLWVLVLAVLSRRRLRGWSFYLATLLRALVAAALLYFIAGPVFETEIEGARRLELHVDHSRSIPEAARQDFLDQARRELAARGDELHDLRLEVYGFAERARLLWQGPVSAFLGDESEVVFQEASAELGELDSDLQASLDLALAHRRQDEGLARVIFSDGALDAPGARDPLPRTWLLAPPGQDERNFSVLDLGVTPVTEAELPLQVTLSWSSTFAGKATIVFEIDGEPIKTQDLDFAPGSGETSLALETTRLALGPHRVRARVEVEDDESADDARSALFELRARRRPLYLTTQSGEPGPALLRAMQAQDLKPLRAEPESLPAGDLTREFNLVLLDGVPAERLSSADGERLRDFVEAGGGLLFLPRDQNDELLAWNRHALADLLPLAGLPEPRIPPEEKPDEKPKDEDDRKLSDPDPERAEEKEVDAPTLVLLLVIDASASMREGARIIYAVRGAIATLRKLHPEDRIGVIAYNDRPMEVVPVQKAADRESIERAIARIEPDGATDIESALLFAQQTLDRETAAVKTVILLSDGFTRPFNVKEVARGLLASGISVTTVGVGSEFDVPLLTQIAKYSGGTGPIPARNARQLPAVMVDVAARLIDQEGLREAPEEKPEKDPEDEKITRPETRLDPKKEEERPFDQGSAATEDGPRMELVIARGASFLDGIPVEDAPPIRGLHRSQEKRGSSVVLKTDDGRNVLAFWRRGDGIAAMATLALEGGWADRLPTWDAFSPLMGQLGRFLMLDAESRALDFQIQALEDQAILEVFDGRQREPAQGWTFRHGDQELAQEPAGEGRYRLQLPPRGPDRFFAFEAVDPTSGAVTPLALMRPLPREIRERGLDLQGLERWREALGGEIRTTWPAKLLPDAPKRKEQGREPFELALVLVFVLMAELALKRLTIGRSSSWS